MTPRTLVVIRLDYGLLQLSAPNLMPTRVLGRPLPRRDQMVLRLLGARHLLQTAVTTAAPTPSVLRYWATGPARTGRRPGGAGVDAADAASMMFAACDRRRRRTALAETVCATGFTIAGVRTAHAGADSTLSGRAATTT